MARDAVYSLAIAEINHCNKCGFCLPACPTYALSGNEVDSPRGRIALVEGVLNGEIGAGGGLEQSLTYCLGCRACETACPSGVQYHRVLAAGKRVLDKTRPHHRGMTLLPRTLVRLAHHPKRLARLARLGRRVRDWPMPKRLKDLTPMLAYHPIAVTEKSPQREADATTTFFRGCVQEALFSDANRAAEELLKQVGYEVVVPSGQTCCGALAWHGGREDEARSLARVNIQAFENSGRVPVVNTAGGCGAMLSEYGEMFSDDPLWSTRAERFSTRVADWSRLLFERSTMLRFVGAGETVGLQNSCHLVNVEGGSAVLVPLIQQVEEDTYVVLPGEDRCCGSAGIYNIQHPDWADRILESKIQEVQTAGIDRLLVVNPGCHMQMTLGIGRLPKPVDVEHLARYLYRAFLRSQGKAEGSDELQ